jgi:hypothetical protein
MHYINSAVIQEREMIKLMKHYVTNGQIKARVHYSRFNMVSTGQDCVTIYAKDYSGDLYKVFGDIVEDNTDITTDYFEKGRVRILPGHPLWEAACQRAS